MMNTSVVIIPEPHIWDKSFKARREYPEEIYQYLAEVIDKIEQLDGDKIIIFPGDIFHRGFSTVPGMTRAISLFVALNKLTSDRVYSCVGNHELSYMNNNPFWMLAQDSSERFSNAHGLEAYGVMSPGIRIVDELRVGPLNFIFGHYNRTDYESVTDGAVQILISHNSILEPVIDEAVNKLHGTESIANYLNVKPLLSSAALPLSESLKYVFVGHMHTYYSSFDVDEYVGDTHLNFFLQYMGSLGRTSVSEINNKDLVRTIPVFKVSDTSYKYEPFTITLKPYEDLVKEDVVADNKKTYSAAKAVKELQRTNIFGETPLECIERHLQPHPDILTLFSKVYRNNLDADIQDLLREAETL